MNSTTGLNDNMRQTLFLALEALVDNDNLIPNINIRKKSSLLYPLMTENSAKTITSTTKRRRDTTPTSPFLSQDFKALKISPSFEMDRRKAEDEDPTEELTIESMINTQKSRSLLKSPISRRKNESANRTRPENQFTVNSIMDSPPLSSVLLTEQIDLIDNSFSITDSDIQHFENVVSKPYPFSENIDMDVNEILQFSHNHSAIFEFALSTNNPSHEKVIRWVNATWLSCIDRIKSSTSQNFSAFSEKEIVLALMEDISNKVVRYNSSLYTDSLLIKILELTVFHLQKVSIEYSETIKKQSKSKIMEYYDSILKYLSFVKPILHQAERFDSQMINLLSSIGGLLLDVGLTLCEHIVNQTTAKGSTVTRTIPFLTQWVIFAFRFAYKCITFFGSERETEMKMQLLLAKLQSKLKRSDLL